MEPLALLINLAMSTCSHCRQRSDQVSYQSDAFTRLYSLTIPAALPKWAIDKPDFSQQLLTNQGCEI